MEQNRYGILRHTVNPQLYLENSKCCLHSVIAIFTEIKCSLVLIVVNTENQQNMINNWWKYLCVHKREYNQISCRLRIACAREQATPQNKQGSRIDGDRGTTCRGCASAGIVCGGGRYKSRIQQQTSVFGAAVAVSASTFITALVLDQPPIHLCITRGCHPHPVNRQEAAILDPSVRGSCCSKFVICWINWM